MRVKISTDWHTLGGSGSLGLKWPTVTYGKRVLWTVGHAPRLRKGYSGDALHNPYRKRRGKAKSL